MAMQRKRMRPLFIKKGSSEKEIKGPGHTFDLRVITAGMEAVVTTLDVGKEFDKEIKHHGEELHIMQEGKVEFIVDGESFFLTEGDWLWHPSWLGHSARNIGKVRAKYLTIGTPPTFI